MPTLTYTTAGAHQFDLEPGATNLVLKCTGAGATGGNAGPGVGGGSGGESTTTIAAPTPGLYLVVVGTANSTTASQVTDPLAAVVCKANSVAGQTGASTTGAVGDSKRAGADGGAAGTGGGGGGASSAGTAAAGNVGAAGGVALGGAGGAAVTGGGAGGAGSDSLATNPVAGSAPGGGGGGNDVGAGGNGAAGAAGQVIATWTAGPSLYDTPPASTARRRAVLDPY